MTRLNFNEERFHFDSQYDFGSEIPKDIAKQMRTNPATTARIKSGDTVIVMRKIEGVRKYFVGVVDQPRDQKKIKILLGKKSVHLKLKQI